MEAIINKLINHTCIETEIIFSRGIWKIHFLITETFNSILCRFVEMNNNRLIECSNGQLFLIIER